MCFDGVNFLCSFFLNLTIYLGDNGCLGLPLKNNKFYLWVIIDVDISLLKECSTMTSDMFFFLETFRFIKSELNNIYLLRKSTLTGLAGRPRLCETIFSASSTLNNKAAT